MSKPTFTMVLCVAEAEVATAWCNSIECIIGFDARIVDYKMSLQCNKIYA